MHIEPANLHISCEHAGRPEEKASRYTGRPGTRGLTLQHVLIYPRYFLSWGAIIRGLELSQAEVGNQFRR